MMKKQARDWFHMAGKGAVVACCRRGVWGLVETWNPTTKCLEGRALAVTCYSGKSLTWCEHFVAEKGVAPPRWQSKCPEVSGSSGIARLRAAR